MLTKIRKWLVRRASPTHPLSRPPTDEYTPPVVLPEALARDTQRILRSFNNDRGREGLVYWAGRPIGRGGVVTTLVVPDSRSDYGRVETDPAENGEVISWLAGHDLVLLGQAHSHPPGSGSRHSGGDDAMTFSPFEGQVSVVVADHAAAEADFLRDWGVHRFVGGQFEFIERSAWSEHLVVVPSVVDRRHGCQADARR